MSGGVCGRPRGVYVRAPCGFRFGRIPYPLPERDARGGGLAAGPARLGLPLGFEPAALPLAPCQRGG